MKKSWTLVIVLVVLAGLLGGYFLLAARPKAKPAAAAEARPDILKLPKGKLVKIVLTRSDGTLIAEKKGADWKLNSPYPITVDTNNMDALVSSFAELQADRVIDENPTDLAQYGLQPPRVTAEATLDDGTIRTLLLGDKTPSRTGYYLQRKGDPKVYSVWMSHGDHFHWTVADLRDKKLSPAIKAEEITYELLKLRGGVTFEIREKNEAEKKSFQTGFGRYIVTRPYSRPVGLDAEKGEPVVKQAASLQIARFVDDNPKSLAPYGLDKPWGEAVVRDTAGTLDVLFGADDGKDRLFFKLKDKPNVYAADKSSVAFMDSRPFDLVEKFAFIPNIEDVDRLEISAAGRTYLLTIARTVKKAEKKGEEDETTATYAVDGKAVEESSFKNFYQVLIGLVVEGEAKKQVADRPDVTTRFFLNKGEPRETTVTYAPYDQDFYAVFVNGKGNFAITRAQVRLMLGKLEQLARGEKLSS